MEGFKLPSSSAPVGTSTVTGSWAGSARPRAAADIPSTFLADLGAKCAEVVTPGKNGKPDKVKAPKGIKKLVFGPTSWVDIGA